MTPTEAIVCRVIEQDGPVTIERIARLCRFARRDVEAAVETLRLSGEPIIADKRGLRLTDDPDELDRYLRSRRDRARSILRASRPLRATVTRLRQRDLTLGLR